MTIDDRITGAAEDVRRSLATTAVPPLEETVEATRRRRPGWQLALAAAALVLIVAGTPFLIASLGDDVDEVATGFQTTVPVEDPVLPDEPFTLVAAPESEDLVWAQLASIVATDSGFVAGGMQPVGESEEDVITVAGIWLSPDGVEWDRIQSPAFAPDETSRVDDVFVVDVAFGPLGYVAVGGQGTRFSPYYDAQAWFSPNGRDWVRAESIEAGSGDGYQTLTKVVAGGPGWVAVGASRGSRGEQSGIWVSSDGLSWSAVDLPLPEPIAIAAVDTFDSTFDISDIVLGDGVLIAVGTTPSGHAKSNVGSPDPFTYEPLVWRSADGLAWDLITLPMPSAPPEDVAATVGTVTVLSDGTFIALGTTLMRGEDYFDRIRRVGLWTSPNGADWRFVEVGRSLEVGDPEMTDTGGLTLIAGSQRLLGVAECRFFELVEPGEWPDGVACVFASSDRGASWKLVASEDPEAAEPEEDDPFGTSSLGLEWVAASEFAGFIDGTLDADGRLVLVYESTVWLEERP
jgi:hypothetical protein